jgi:hypothetical protein
MFGGAKEQKVVFFESDWFDLVNGTKGIVLSRQESYVCTSSAADVLPKLSSRKHETLVSGV